MPRLLFGLFATLLYAQSDVSLILRRLERLEEENAKLRAEVVALRTKVDSLTPTVPERLEIAERRIEEQAATKVEAANRFPIEVSGMALFNTFYNSQGSGGVDVPTQASAANNRAAGGLTFRQSIFGLQFHGPRTVFGAAVSGSAFGDFWDGTTESTGNLSFRVRTAEVALDWQRRGVTVGLLKPLISPHNPNSFATVGVSPLTASGNLWRWQPQIRYEERLGGLTLQAAVMQTSEQAGLANASLAQTRRPSLQLRSVLMRSRFELGVGGHLSESRVLDQSVPSRVFSLDWLIKPIEKVEISGLFFNGSNVHHMGAFRQSFRFDGNGAVGAVRSRGGWAQLAVAATSRISLNLFAGIHDDRNADLLSGQNGRNRTGGANIMFRVAPNVLLSFETLQTRSLFLGLSERRVNRYDLSLAYLF